MIKTDNLTDIRKKISPILKRYGILRASIFGSAARGEARKDSDIDLLVELGSDKSLLDLIELKLELEKTLSRKVDIVEYSGIHPLLKDRIMKEQVAML